MINELDRKVDVQNHQFWWVRFFRLLNNYDKNVTKILQ